MAIIRPFKAIRPEKKYADKVVSLPYDVMNRAEAAHMADGNPYSFLHICRSEIDMPEQENPYDHSVYQRAKANIAQNLEDGVFVQEKKPVLYLYKQVMDGRAQVGIVGCVSVDEYMNNDIKKHEFTRVEKEKDRINHFDICNANTEPVFLTYRDNKKIRSLMEGWIANHEALYDLETPDGIQHVLWTVDDDSTIQALSELFGEVPALYIADGHHRSASACKVGLKRREENPDYTGEEEFNFFMAVVFPDSDLKIFDYNRVVKDLNGHTPEQFLTKIKEAGFEVEELGTDAYRPEGKHIFGMYLQKKWYKLTAGPAMVPDHVIDSLDVSILQDKLLAPILGIADPRTDKRIDFVGGIRGLEELERRTETDMLVAFAVHPVGIEDLLTVADHDMVMPPKSTWFEPKLGSGLFVHQL
ncbi:DUF1015 domain-containing protein [Aminipila butyrica]|uniref:DUF1015 domain-containing protein n=1 Tax=Aminipila butyrica TaxID=433296 RepID=A0A858BVB5_9FIRM|nr:DUF1015 family protein [Aminipila butyrica]QIB69883.1 DUF1015 domain-containing protein [Aminipila butyrica]